MQHWCSPDRDSHQGQCQIHHHDHAHSLSLYHSQHRRHGCQHRCQWPTVAEARKLQTVVYLLRMFSSVSMTDCGWGEEATDCCVSTSDVLASDVTSPLAVLTSLLITSGFWDDVADERNRSTSCTASNTHTHTAVSKATIKIY